MYIANISHIYVFFVYQKVQKCDIRNFTIVLLAFMFIRCYNLHQLNN